MIKKTAHLSPTGMYRYSLTRVWDGTLPQLGWIMLNPSTADAEVDDPTIGKCMGFARRGGYGGIAVANLFAFRATDPKDLKRSPEPIGPDNDAWISWTLGACHHTVLAWGAHGSFLGRSKEINEMIDTLGCGSATYALARTKDGEPRHPLYLPYELMTPDRAKS